MPVAIGILGLQESVTGIRAILVALSGNFPAAIAVLVPMKSMFRPLLPELLGATHAHERDLFEPGRVLVAPPGRTMRIRADTTVALELISDDDDVASLAGPFFTSLADVFGPGAIAVVYSGWDDSVNAVARAGGKVIIRDRAEPTLAPRAGLVLARERIAPTLAQLVSRSYEAE